MLKGGEDPVFIARRMLIAASEDIGNSNPNALLLAGECFRSVQAVGMPEARIILGQTAVYLATSAKVIVLTSRLIRPWNLLRKRQIYQYLYT